jgi:hypothetical protein
MQNALPYSARAMSFVDVAYLTREALHRTLLYFPESAAKLRRFGIFIALRRRLGQVARVMKQEVPDDRQSSPSLVSLSFRVLTVPAARSLSGRTAPCRPSDRASSSRR